MIKPDPSQELFACPHCGWQILVESEHWGSTGLCSHCGNSVTLPDSDIPEDFAIAVELDRRRNEDVFAGGAVCGGLCYAIVLLIFAFLPAIWSSGGLPGSWGFNFSAVIRLLTGTLIGALAGGVLLWLRTATLTSSRAALQGAMWGMAIGFSVGALLGASFVFLRSGLSISQAINFVWLAQGERVAYTSIMFGSALAFFGSLAGSHLAKPQAGMHPSDPRARSVQLLPSDRPGEPKTRYQFGIKRILILSAAVALVIAIPAQLLVRVMKVSQLGRNAIAFEIMIVLCVLLMLTVVTWAVMRGPTVYTRLASAFVRWRGLKQNRDELKQWGSSKK